MEHRSMDSAVTIGFLREVTTACLSSVSSVKCGLCNMSSRGEEAASQYLLDCAEYSTNACLFVSLGLLWNQGRPRYPCKICGHTYRHKTNLSNHMKSHQGETICHLCRKVFSNKNNLGRHLAQCHGIC
uniref:C2H2-type domain-containing protein n=1 Tax=Timema douglasi TaxID=61478 RepID=A0A7R8VS84_TIMDO|nr:unnamed protein product [Timema douglasi]